MKNAYYNTRFGILKITYKNNFLYYLKITKEKIDQNYKNEFTDNIYNQILEYLKGNLKYFDIKYKMIGTDFQKKVWKELKKIPYGKTMTYLDIAKSIKNVKAVRAVGRACNKNPLWIIIPCHRVIGSNNKLIGYAGGIDMKKELLNIEKNN